jgi:hypothetical protein
MVRHSDFVIDSSFELRHSSLPHQHGASTIAKRMLACGISAIAATGFGPYYPAAQSGTSRPDCFHFLRFPHLSHS